MIDSDRFDRPKHPDPPHHAPHGEARIPVVERAMPGTLTIPPNEVTLTRAVVIVSWLFSVAAMFLVVAMVAAHLKSFSTFSARFLRRAPRRRRPPVTGTTPAAHLFSGRAARSRCIPDSDGRMELLLLAAFGIAGEATNALIAVQAAPHIRMWPAHYTARAILFFPIGGISLLIITLRVAGLCFKSISAQRRMWHAALLAFAFLTPPFIAGNLILAPENDWDAPGTAQSPWWAVLLYVNAVFPIAVVAMTAYSVHVTLAHRRALGMRGALVSRTPARLGGVMEASSRPHASVSAVDVTAAELASPFSPPPSPTVRDGPDHLRPASPATGGRPMLSSSLAASPVVPAAAATVPASGGSESPARLSAPAPTGRLKRSSILAAVRPPAMTITPRPPVPPSAPAPANVLSLTTSSTSGLSTTSQTLSTATATDAAAAAPTRRSTSASVQGALGTTFWVLSTGYLLVWFATLAYNALSNHNGFLRMAVTTCLSTCWLVVEALFKLIVRARVRRSRRGHAIKARAAMAPPKPAVTPASGTPALDLILDSVRRRIEHDDRFDTFLLSYSTAGGTGSGVSARLVMELKDWMPRAALVSVPILPFAKGDTAVQAYNTVLALAAAQDHADSIVAVPNDVLFGVAERRGVFAVASGGGKGMEGVNAIAAEMIAAVVGPSRAGVHASGPTARVASAECELFSGWDLVTSLCPIPMCKVLHVASSGVVAVNKFHDAVKAVCRYTLMPPDRVPSCLGATAYLSPTFSAVDLAYLQRKLNDRLGFVPAVNPTPLAHRTTATGTRTTASLAFVHNTGVLADRHVLTPWLTATAKRLRSRAYLHRYPSAAEWIGNASCGLWGVVDEYRALL
ncbi:hypothetical protein GGF31_007364 [Allomyces arbusculus]|nr:hypothetical protein GGF31_007364 [Allomyces arbusculus]